MVDFLVRLTYRVTFHLLISRTAGQERQARETFNVNAQFQKNNKYSDKKTMFVTVFENLNQLTKLNQIFYYALFTWILLV